MSCMGKGAGLLVRISLLQTFYFAKSILAAGILVKLSPHGSGNVIFPSGNALKYLSEYFDDNTETLSPYEEIRLI